MTLAEDQARAITGMGGSTPKQSKLNELIEKVQRITEVINSSRHGLDNGLDRLLGERPECATNDEASPSRIGVIGQLEDNLDVLDCSVNQIKDSINRLLEADIM